MADTLKSDIVSGAFSRLRISGITKNPTTGDNELGLEILEDTASELEGLNIGLDYFFEDTPDLGTPHNVPKEYWGSLKAILAGRLAADFGKELTEALQRRVSAAWSFLYSATATPREIEYPRRMPIGSGNSLRYYRFRRFYTPAEQAENSPETNKMIIGDVDNFVEHFDAYLVADENIASYVISSDNGLVIVSDSLSTPDISYQVRADGTGNTNTGALYQVKIVATTDAGRITTRLIDFELTTIPDLS